MSDPTIADAQLIERVRRGDTAAFAELIDRHQDRLRVALGCRCRHADDVEEFLQEAFVQAYVHLDRFNLGADFYPWLRAIAVNLLSKEARRRATAQGNARGYLRWLQAARPDDEPVEDEPTVPAIDACIERLPSPSRGLVLAHYRDGRPLDQLATELGTSLNALQVRLVRIRRLLRECVGRPQGGSA